MIPVVTPAEMAAIDAAASDPVEVLVDRAGRAVAREAVRLMGGCYGRRCCVIAGPGNNGADGRVAAEYLRRRGVRALVMSVAEASEIEVIGPCDLVIDAAFGTGLARNYTPPRSGSTPVLAVDIPSGVDGLTGELRGQPLVAERTITFAALKPGLMFYPGRAHAGEIVVADIGLDVGTPTVQVCEASDVSAIVPRRPADDHKWKSAVWVIGGSPGMTGAASLAARAAQRAGAGYVRSSTPGDRQTVGPIEAVGYPLPSSEWAAEVVAGIDRIAALVIGPGLGRAATTGPQVRLVLDQTDVPAVIDGDGLTVLGATAAGTLGARQGPSVVTPHDGEYAAVMGHGPGADRVAAARAMADALGCVTLLKGPTTVVASPEGDVALACHGDQRLATAGSGDVLAGIIGAFLACGLDASAAATAAAYVHGATLDGLPGSGVIAGDLVQQIPYAIDGLPGR